MIIAAPIEGVHRDSTPRREIEWRREADDDEALSCARACFRFAFVCPSVCLCLCFLSIHQHLLLCLERASAHPNEQRQEASPHWLPLLLLHLAIGPPLGISARIGRWRGTQKQAHRRQQRQKQQPKPALITASATSAHTRAREPEAPARLASTGPGPGPLALRPIQIQTYFLKARCNEPAHCHPHHGSGHRAAIGRGKEAAMALPATTIKPDCSHSQLVCLAASVRNGDLSWAMRASWLCWRRADFTLPASGEREREREAAAGSDTFSRNTLQESRTDRQTDGQTHTHTGAALNLFVLERGRCGQYEGIRETGTKMGPDALILLAMLLALVLALARCC